MLNWHESAVESIVEINMLWWTQFILLSLLYNRNCLCVLFFGCHYLAVDVYILQVYNVEPLRRPHWRHIPTPFECYNHPSLRLYHGRFKTFGHASWSWGTFSFLTSDLTHVDVWVVWLILRVLGIIIIVPLRKSDFLMLIDWKTALSSPFKPIAKYLLYPLFAFAVSEFLT